MINKNGFEFTIEQTSDFDARRYSPMKYDVIPDLKRGTIAYDDYWDEQDRRCLEGFAPKGMPKITGRHYFYLNFFNIKLLEDGATKKTFGLPYYRVLDHLLFLEIELAMKKGYGLLIGKPRRVGLSYLASLNIAYELLFFLDNETAVGAYKDDKAKPLMEKVYKGLQLLREEYKVSIKKTKDDLKIKYTVIDNKVMSDKGIGSSLDVKTFFSDASAFEGGSYSFFVFEEIGLQENLIKSYKASEFCFMEGGIQFGFPMLFGTAGEVDKGSKDFKIMWDNPKAYNLKKLFIPAYMHYPGSAEEDDEETESVNFFDIKTGRTDEIAALKHIKSRRIRALKSKDGYIKEIQSRPIEEKDLFLKTSGGLLDRIKINGQLRVIDSEDVAYKPIQGRLEWVDDEIVHKMLNRCTNQKEKAKIRISRGSKVVFVDDINGTVCKILDPIKGSGFEHHPDIAGTDSYDEENLDGQPRTSNGCTIIYRTFSGMSREYDLPIAYVYERGDGTSNDTFYENSLKLCVYYGSKTLVEYSKILIINYFQDVNAEEYLKENPDLRSELLATKGRNKYGFKMTTGAKGSKELITKLLKIEVQDNIYKYWFPEILLDLIDFGDSNTDIAMALALVLVHKLDIFDYISDDLEIEDVSVNDILSCTDFYDVENGNLMIKSYGESNSFDNIEVFDPRKHLEGKDRKDYLDYMDEKKKMLDEERRKRFEKQTYHPEDPFMVSVNEELKKREDNEL